MSFASAIHNIRLPVGGAGSEQGSLSFISNAFAEASHVELVVAAIIVAALTYLWFAVARKPKYDLDLIPGPWRKAYPIVGNILPCLRPDFHRQTLEWADTYGGIYRMKFLWRDALVVTDPWALGTIMGRGEGALDKAAMIYAPINTMCDPHGHANLLTAPADEKWKAIRKAVAVSFSIQNIKKKYPLILSKVNQLLGRVAALGPETSIDVDQAALRVTLDVIGLAGFNHDYKSVEKDVPEYEHLLRVLPRCFTEVMLRIANPVRNARPDWFKNGPKGSTAFKMFQDEMRVLLKQLKEKEPEPDNFDIAAQLYRALKDNPDVSDDRILSEIGILFVEGFETTGHTTSWTLYNIATVPGVQEKIAEELDGLGLLAKPGCPPPRELELDDLKRIPYLAACAKEAMRMFPVVSIMGRVCQKVEKVGPYTVPAGTVVGTPLFAIQNSIHNWDDPHSFKPERWLDVPIEQWVYNSKEAGGNGKAKGITFMPFSEGPRNCVGQSLAKMEVLTLLTKLLSNFQLELAPEMGGREGIRKRESTHLTLQTAGTKGIRCHLQPRSENVAAGVLVKEQQ